MPATLDALKEFDQQIATLADKGYPALADLDSAAFGRQLEPLRELAAELNPRHGDASFVIVVKSELVPADVAISRVVLGGRSGFSVMEASDLARFAPIAGIEIPAGPAYLLTGVETGAETLNVRPNDALEMISRAGRSPLTIEEGLALVTHYPHLLRDRNCFSMLGSRCGDKRVTALWLSKRTPKLGWCWAGNPHTWLGSASCAGRLGPAA